MSYKEVILVGYSGHGYVVAEAAEISGHSLLGYADKTKVDQNHFNLDYLGYEQNSTFDWNINDNFILGIGDNTIRHKLGQLITLKGKTLLNIIHPEASISEYLEIGMGNFIARNATINPIVKLGNYCIINTGSIIEHECSIGDAVHIAPGAVLAGNVRIGDRSFIGANSVIKQGVSIGKNVIIGAGSVVLKDIKDNETIVGNPGREI